MGGTLTANTTINGSSSFNLNVTGTITASPLVVITNTNAAFNTAFKSTSSGSAGIGVHGVANSGYGVYGETSTSVGAYGYSFSSGVGVKGESAGAGAGVDGVSSSGVGVSGTSTTGVAGVFSINPSSTNTVVEVMRLVRASSGTPANGIGASLQFLSETTVQNSLSNNLISKWTDATDATRTSQFIITGVNNTVTADLFTLSGNGQLQLNKYGVDTFYNTPVRTLGVDGSGNVVEFVNAADTNIYNTSGTLTANRVVTTTASYKLTVTGSSPVVFEVVNTGVSLGTALKAEAYSGIGAYITNNTNDSNYPTIYAGNSGTALVMDLVGTTDTLVARIRSQSPSTNTVIPYLELYRYSGGTAADGIGTSIDFRIQSPTGGDTIATRLISKWTTAAFATRTSQFIISGVNSGITADLLTLSGSGQTQLNKYGIGTFTGTAAKYLAVTA